MPLHAITMDTIATITMATITIVDIYITIANRVILPWLQSLAHNYYGYHYYDHHYHCWYYITCTKLHKCKQPHITQVQPLLVPICLHTITFATINLCSHHPNHTTLILDLVLLCEERGAQGLLHIGESFPCHFSTIASAWAQNGNTKQKRIIAHCLVDTLEPHCIGSAIYSKHICIWTYKRSFTFSSLLSSLFSLFYLFLLFFLFVSFCRSVPPEFLRSFLNQDSVQNRRKQKVSRPRRKWKVLSIVFA